MCVVAPLQQSLIDAALYDPEAHSNSLKGEQKNDDKDVRTISCIPLSVVYKSSKEGTNTSPANRSNNELSSDDVSSLNQN